MRRESLVETRVYISWDDYQQALKKSIAPLTAEQLALRLVPHLRSVGEIAEHIVYGRALWLAREVNDASADVAPLLRWEDPADPPHSAAEILAALDLTWQRFNALMQRWAAYGEDFPAAEADTLGALWGMLDHDLPHIGELVL